MRVTSGSGVRDPGSDPHVPRHPVDDAGATAAAGSRITDPGSRQRQRRVAIVHDWLTGMRGGEKVLDAICDLYPDATLYTLVHVPGSVSPRIEAHRIERSLVNWLPKSGQFYRQYLPLFPMAVELFDLSGYDLVISSSHCAVKSVIRAASATHVCYCHSPMRYAWDQFEAYFGAEQVGRFRSRLLRPVLASLARWDAATAGRVDRFLANSQYVAGRIRRYYNRGSTVVHPPVDTAFYQVPALAAQPADPYFLMVTALVPYKRVIVAMDACRKVGARLKIVGRGPDENRLRQAAGPDVEFVGWRSDEDVREFYGRATAVLLPGTEDFGMVPVEAQACGTPVVAFGEGGACETVLDGTTGVLVGDPSVEAFADGLQRVRALRLDRAAIRQHAEQFSRAHFIAAFQRAVAEAIAEREAAL